MDLDLAGLLIERDLGHTRRQRVMIVGERNAHPAAGPFLAEVGHLGHCLEHGVGARLVLGQLEPQRQRILARSRRDFVKEGFGGELIVAGADATPWLHAHAADFARVIGQDVGNGIERLVEAARADIVLAAGGLEARRRR